MLAAIGTLSFFEQSRLLYGAPSRSILERDKTSDAERNYPYNIRTAHGPAATPDLTG